MKYPNNMQACLLFDQQIDNFDSLAFLIKFSLEEKFGSPFSDSDAVKGSFHSYLGKRNLRVTVQKWDQPADRDDFDEALRSEFALDLCPDLRARAMTHRAHMLITVEHNVLGGLFEELDLPDFLGDMVSSREGNSLASFIERLEVLGLAVGLICERQPPQLIHWYQCDLLVAPDQFMRLSKSGVPGLLHIRPSFGDRNDGAIVTHGAEHFIGGEIAMEASDLPRAAKLDMLVSFLKMATLRNGYVTPDGEVFHPEGGSMSCRVLHKGKERGTQAAYVLVPIRGSEQGASSHHPDPRDSRPSAPPVRDVTPGSGGDEPLADIWQLRRVLADDSGAPFAPQPVPAAVRSVNLPHQGGQRPVFGRKRFG